MRPLKTLVVLASLFLVDSASTPLVIWHCLGVAARSPWRMGLLVSWLQTLLPDSYIMTLSMGADIWEDRMNSLAMDANTQVEKACQMVSTDPRLSGGFNLLGMSQGGLLARGLVQRCTAAKVLNLITMAAEHQGIYGLPMCINPDRRICQIQLFLILYTPYHRSVQNLLLQSQYFHDPMNEEGYRRGSDFLADLNQEERFNATYKKNMLRLKRFVMVMYQNESLVVPKETEWFSYYRPGQVEEILPLRHSPIYTKDLLGLKQLDHEGRLVFIRHPGDHLQWSRKWIVRHLIPYLKD